MTIQRYKFGELYNTIESKAQIVIIMENKKIVIVCLLVLNVLTGMVLLTQITQETNHTQQISLDGYLQPGKSVIEIQTTSHNPVSYSIRATTNTPSAGIVVLVTSAEITSEKIYQTYPISIPHYNKDQGTSIQMAGLMSADIPFYKIFILNYDTNKNNWSSTPVEYSFTATIIERDVSLHASKIPNIIISAIILSFGIIALIKLKKIDNENSGNIGSSNSLCPNCGTKMDGW